MIDDAIQVHGGAGVSDDSRSRAMYAGARTLRIADGPDEVHVRSVARAELARQRRPNFRSLLARLEELLEALEDPGAQPRVGFVCRAHGLNGHG